MKYSASTWIVLFFLLGMALTFNAGCQFDKVDITGDPTDTTGTDPNDTIVQSDCDPNTVYFEKDVFPIIASSCAKSGCHDAASHQDGVILDSYENIMNTADIRPGNPGGSDLYEHITEDDEDKRMPPPPNDPLTQEQIALIRKWIQTGAQNLTCNEGNACDDSNVTYTQTVASILQKNCVGCHNPNFTSGNVILSTYSGASAVAKSGLLYGVISHTPGFKPMPLSGNKLSDCNIKLIKKWVDNGAPNN